MKRRQILAAGGAGSLAALPAACGGGGEAGEASQASEIERTVALSERSSGAGAGPVVPNAAVAARVIVIGGGMAGTTVAKYLRLWSNASTAAPLVHVLGDSSSTTQPKAGHVANQEAKVCADALVRIFGGGAPDPAPVTNSACYSTITMSQASWLSAGYQYDPAARVMSAVPVAFGASSGWSSGNFSEMGTWFNALMADTFA
ncbi:MAG: FCSD flavin-binding domain-containing protein [Rubrivivax sp.]|nr:FCSD flavin-binding domain-containing protein [Rubrivivax sp.]